MSKKDFLFRFVDPKIRADMLFDDEALYSTTDQLTADKITKDILKFISKDALIIDGTACVGGNTYSFGQTFRKVIAYELDPKRALYLAHNMKLLGLTNVECIHGDILDHISFEQNPECIFLDPPWGGPEYKQKERVQLCLSQKTLPEVCEKLAHFTNYIAIKVPTNFDEFQFQIDCNTVLELVCRNTQLRKMHLLIYRVRKEPCHK
jgi:16S rRNA G966 N2-methylase RsmD